MVLEKIAVLKELTIFSVLLRTVLAMVFSGILGYESCLLYTSDAADE